MHASGSLGASHDTFNQIEKFDVGFNFERDSQSPTRPRPSCVSYLIQRQGLGDTLIDVANYLHVTTGPGILLIGHQAFRTVQLDQAKAGIILSGRRMKASPTTSFLGQHLQALVEFGLALEAHFGRTLFDPTKLTIRINDRRFTPEKSNAQSLLSAVNDALEAIDLRLKKLSLRDSDPREQPAIDVQLKDIGELRSSIHCGSLKIRLPNHLINI